MRPLSPEDFPKPADFPGWPGSTESAQPSRGAGVRGSFAASRLPEVTRGRLERMRAAGAPAWLIEEERSAQAQGYTLRRMRGCGRTWYRMPIDEQLFEDRALRLQERRLERERPGFSARLPRPGFDAGLSFDNE